MSFDIASGKFHRDSLTEYSAMEENLQGQPPRNAESLIFATGNAGMRALGAVME